MKRNVTLPIILFVITFYYIISSISAQVLEPQNYDNDVVNISNATSGTCNNCNIGNIRFWPANNIPNVNSIVKIVKVDFNILQNGSGGGNFINSTTDAQNGIPRLNNILGWINNYYNNNEASNIIPLNVTVNNLPKEDIQFELGNIYFYNNATYWKSSNVSTLLNLVINDVSRNPNAVNDRLQLFFSEGWYNGSILSHITVTNGGSGYTSPPNVSFASPSNAQATAQISNGSVVSITITSGDTIEYSSTNDPATHYGAPDVTISGGGGAGATAFVDKIGGGAAAYAPIPNCVLSNQGYVLAFGAFHGDLNPDHTIGDFASATTLAHELGHNLGLIHTYTGGRTSANCSTNSNDPTYMDDIYGLPAPGNCPHNVSWGCALLSVPNKIDNNMMGGNQCAGYFSPKQIGYMHRALRFNSVRKYLKECYYDNLNPLSVSSTETWDFDVLWDKDIDIQSGATLNLTCKLSMPQTSSITVESGAILNIDGIVTNNSDNGWNGTIHIKPGGILNLKANAEITFIGSGKILIDDNVTNPGLLTIEGIPKVYLNGNNTMIDIRGLVDIKNNSTFSFFHQVNSTTQGFIKFANTSLNPSRNITAGNNCNINFTGSSQSKKILQID